MTNYSTNRSPNNKLGEKAQPCFSPPACPFCLASFKRLSSLSPMEDLTEDREADTDVRSPNERTKNWHIDKMSKSKCGIKFLSALRKIKMLPKTLTSLEIPPSGKVLQNWPKVYTVVLRSSVRPQETPIGHDQWTGQDRLVYFNTTLAKVTRFGWFWLGNSRKWSKNTSPRMATPTNENVKLSRHFLLFASGRHFSLGRL